MAGDAPYAGVRVLDLGQGVAAPHCGLLLAQHGADVVKVEPLDGDWARGLGAAHGDHSALSIPYNVGKRSIALDLKSPRGVEAALRLAARADVVLESFRSGVADRLGVGYEAVRACNPRVIYASVSGFGQSGPYRDRPCTDMVAQAYTGLMSVNRGSDGIPHRVGVIIIDAVTGVYAFGAVAAALAARGTGGEGRYLDLSLAGCGVAVQASKVAEHALEGGAPQLLNSPAGTYRTADGWIAVTVTRESHFRNLCQVIGLDELADDPRFATFAARARHHEPLVAIVAARLAERGTRQWLERFHACGVLAERILDHGEWLADPHTVASGGAVAVQVAGVGPVLLPRIPGCTGYRGAPPRVGEHGAEVLREAGYADERIEALRAAGVLGGAPHDDLHEAAKDTRT